MFIPMLLCGSNAAKNNLHYKIRTSLYIVLTAYFN
jgi:hypothetical protein